ncbi:MAG: hypothetical protein FWG30_04660 [Eubacteriaceae bacterium]|nr:hypothetical protein [Eubacteriaceae bacterium]
MKSKIAVIGVGGSGIQAIRKLSSDSKYKDLDFLHIIDSDRDDLMYMLSGKELIEIDESDLSVLRHKLAGVDILFMVAALGNEPVPKVLVMLNSIAKEFGITTIGLVSKPFGFESELKKKTASLSVSAMQGELDCLFVIPIEHIGFHSLDNKKVIYKVYDETMSTCLKALLDPMVVPSLVNIDPFEFKMLTGNAGSAYMGFGRSLGEGRAEAAISAAVYSPFIEQPIIQARSILCTVQGSSELEFDEIEEIMRFIRSESRQGANITFSVVQVPEMRNEIRVTVCLIGFSDDDDEMALFLPDAKGRSFVS